MNDKIRNMSVMNIKLLHSHFYCLAHSSVHILSVPIHQHSVYDFNRCSGHPIPAISSGQMGRISLSRTNSATAPL